MMNTTRLAIAVITLTAATPLRSAAQSTGTASFSAPVRAFRHTEVGAYLGYPESGITVIEGSYRGVSGIFDVGIRGGTGGGWTMAGFDARTSIFHHRGPNLLDGAIVFGAGGQFRHAATRFEIPVGLSIGRRFGGPDSKFSLTPYVQPTTFLQGGNGMTTRMNLGVGFGVDLGWAHVVDLRLGTGTGDFSGVSFGLVWVH
jgi:hypothetical protein